MNRLTKGSALAGKAKIYSQPPQVRVVEVDASGGGTGQTTDIIDLAIGDILLDVVALVTESFDGDTTKTLEVGIAANADKYIDTVDFDPSGAAGTQAAMHGGTTNDQKQAEYITAAATMIATWTNTASATAGKVKVYVLYIPSANTRADGS